MDNYLVLATLFLFLAIVMTIRILMDIAGIHASIIADKIFKSNGINWIFTALFWACFFYSYLKI